MLKVGCILSEHEKQNGCYECCATCNVDRHECPGCGTSLMHDGREYHTGKYHLDCVEEIAQYKGKVIAIGGK